MMIADAGSATIGPASAEPGAAQCTSTLLTGNSAAESLVLRVPTLSLAVTGQRLALSMMIADAGSATIGPASAEPGAAQCTSTLLTGNSAAESLVLRVPTLSLAVTGQRLAL